MNITTDMCVCHMSTLCCATFINSLCMLSLCVVRKLWAKEWKCLLQYSTQERVHNRYNGGVTRYFNWKLLTCYFLWTEFYVWWTESASLCSRWRLAWESRDMPRVNGAHLWPGSSPLLLGPQSVVKPSGSWNRRCWIMLIPTLVCRSRCQSMPPSMASGPCCLSWSTAMVLHDPMRLPANRSTMLRHAIQLTGSNVQYVWGTRWSFLRQRDWRLGADSSSVTGQPILWKY